MPCRATRHMERITCTSPRGGAIVLLVVMAGLAPGTESVQVNIPSNVTRPWIEPQVWTNPAEDWQVRQGRVENTHSGGGRSAILLTAELTQRLAPFSAQTRLQPVETPRGAGGFAGLVIGIQGDWNDYRDSAVHGTGILAGWGTGGKLFIGSPIAEDPVCELPAGMTTLTLTATPTQQAYRVELRATDAEGNQLGISRRENVHPSWLTGLVGIMASTVQGPVPALGDARPTNLPRMAQARGGNVRFSFDHLEVSGDKVRHDPERAYGPIMWTTHTLDNAGMLKMLVQCAPFGRDEQKNVTLHIAGHSPVTSSMDPVSRTASFAIPDLDGGMSHPYQVHLDDAAMCGVLRAIPTDRPVTVVAMTCNDSTGFPHQSLVRNVADHHPDVLAFLGDQIYEGVGGYGVIYDQQPNDRAVVCYLRKYFLHGWSWKELLRDIPSVTIPDDHDVFHGNLWGAGGVLADVSLDFGSLAQDSGGYKMSPEFVNAVHRAQTGNLPDGAGPSPVGAGISTYYTRWAYGLLDMAVLADRQFKSAPRDLLPAARIENGWPQNLEWDVLRDSDHPDAELLGPDQERFLAQWAAKPASGTRFRIVLSQTPWCAPQTLPADMQSDRGVPSLPVLRPGEYPADDRPTPDFDTNGWPQSKRTAALRSLRRANAIHIAGDQHLGTTGQYGLDAHGDGPWWIVTPAIANVWPRRWMPAQEGQNRREGDPTWLGEFRDGFGNRITLHAVANPMVTEREPARLYHRAVGYTVTRCDPANGRVSLENWPYWASPARPAPDNQPYPGWPVVIEPVSGARIDTTVAEEATTDSADEHG